MHLSNATYFYTNFDRHRNRPFRGVPEVGEIGPDRLRFARRSSGSRFHATAALYQDDPVRKTVF
jgi:hypothetical protein